jgi:hypothetical protein
MRRGWSGRFFVFTRRFEEMEVLKFGEVEEYKKFFSRSVEGNLAYFEGGQALFDFLRQVVNKLFDGELGGVWWEV